MAETGFDAKGASQALNRWYEVRSSALRGDDQAEKELAKTPTVAGRPLWVSLLTKEQQKAMDDARKQMEQEKK